MWKKVSDFLQLIGRSMLLPVAAMPAAALLNRFGDADMLNMMYIKEAGWTVFKYLPVLFAIGISGGMAKDRDVASGLAAFVGYEIIVNLLQPFNGTALNTFGSTAIPDISSNVLFGIIAGVMTGLMYNRFKDTELPSALAFFSGKRLVIILNSFLAILIAALLNVVFPYLDYAMDTVGVWIGGSTVWGPFAFGFFNRLLIPTGLHHIVNAYILMQLPSPDAVFSAAHPNIVGEIPRYFAGDPTAGGYVAGFFPIMMFGLPAAAAAMIYCAHPENRGKVAGLLAGAALASFLTGITEPVEFSFMFAAVPLYVLHAVFTGLANVLANLLHAKHMGVGGNGIIDFVLQWNKATNPWNLVWIGLGMSGLYFVSFTWAIKKFDFMTPGREPVVEEQVKLPLAGRAALILELIGGAANIEELANCVSRLRLKLADPDKVEAEKLRTLGVLGVVKLSNNRVQIIVGLEAELIAGKLRELTGK